MACRNAGNQMGMRVTVKQLLKAAYGNWALGAFNVWKR
jgi:hypothetical protein